MATAASVMLLLTILSPAQTPQTSSPITASQLTMQINDEDANEFSELVMLETWERY
jgi:hypothetical protein